MRVTRELMTAETGTGTKVIVGDGPQAIAGALAQRLVEEKIL